MFSSFCNENKLVSKLLEEEIARTDVERINVYDWVLSGRVKYTFHVELLFEGYSN